MKLISETGTSGAFYLDDQLLAESLELDTGDSFDFDWSSDLTELTITHTDPEGTVNNYVEAIDLSDAGIEEALSFYETETGRSAQAYRDYFAEYGNPWVPDANSTAVQRHSFQQGENAPALTAFKFVGGGAAILSGTQAIITGVKMYKLAVGAANVARVVMIAFGAGGVFALGVLLILTTIFLVFICYPCTLACFTECDSPEPREQSRCRNDGAVPRLPAKPGIRPYQFLP